MMILKRPRFADVATIGDLLTCLGHVPAKRVLFHPSPGTATEKDLLTHELPCELIDHTLVEKPLGLYESILAGTMLYFIETFLENNDFGITVGGNAPYRIRRGTVRKPDATFVSWDKIPDGLSPSIQIAKFAPDLSIEVLNPGNTKTELLRKREEFFGVGTKLYWEIDPRQQTAHVFTSPRESTHITSSGILDGCEVLPGFRLSLRELFARARVSPPQPRKPS